MRDLLHRLGCFVQLTVTALVAGGLHTGLGWGLLLSVVVGVPAGMVGTFATMFAASLLLDHLGVD